MSVIKNLGYNVLYQVLILIIPLITTPYISRVLGPAEMGAQSYTYSIAYYFVLFAMLGINNYGNRSVAISKADYKKLSKTFTSIYCLQLIMSMIMLIIYIVVFIFIKSKYKIFFIIQSLYIIATALDINWFFFGMEEFRLTVIRNTIIKLASMICVFVFVRDSNDIYIYSLILSGSMFLSNIILWRFIGKYTRFTTITKCDIKQHIKPVLLLFIPIIAISIYKIMDKVMLGSISGVNQVGIYENSEKIVSIPMSIIVAVGTVMMPKISNLESEGKINESRKYISISMEIFMCISVGAMFGLIGVSDIMIPIFLGEKFIESIDIVKLLSITLIFLSWANIIRTQFLIPKKRDTIYIASTILGAIVNLTINLLLIPKYGVIGASIGTIVAEASVAIYQTFRVRKELDINKYFTKTVFYIVPGTIMYLIIKYIGTNSSVSISTLIIQVIAGGFIYITISLIYMNIIKNEVILITKNRINYLLSKKKYIDV